MSNSFLLKVSRPTGPASRLPGSLVIRKACLCSLVALALATCGLFAQVPAPESVLGYRPGADFKLTTYEESLAYFQKLDAASDYLKLVNVGKTSQGRDWYVALISTPQNLAQLDKFKDIARRLAQVKGLNDEQAHQLAREGKAIVHIDGGLHATEVAGQEHTMGLAYNLVSRPNDPEVAKILNEVIFVLWISLNPDGQTMVANWYRKNLGTTYEVSPLPWLYQEYVGHDNNRDGYMNNMIESRVINKAMQDFWPQVMYNHHQTAPFPSRIWIPPFAEPVSTQVHPLMWRWVNVFGTSMAAYLDQHDMPGAMHRGRYDDWYPGFIDHVNSFRNTVSFLTETALYRYATPRYYTIDEFPSEKQDLRAEVFYSSPWKGGWWRLQDAVNYMQGASMAVLSTAAKNREELLFTRYQAGRDTIDRYTKEPPFAYVIPREQRDLPTAAILIEKLMLAGLEVQETTDPVAFNGIEYKAGSWVIAMDQPFARLAHELFEVQKYPELPDAPYDVTGWTLPMQMGVETVSVKVPIEAAARAKMRRLNVAPQVNSPVTRMQNVSFKVINEAFAAGAKPDAKLNPPGAAPRIGLYRPWAASIDEGWTRWIFEQYKFPYKNLYNAEIQAGHLKERFDVIVIPDMSKRTILEGHQAGAIEGRYAGGIGDSGTQALRDFVNGGGTLVTLNNASQFAIDKLNLPVINVLSGLRQAEFNCPGALLRVEIADLNHPLVTGLPKEVNVMFERGPAFETKSGFKGKILAAYPREANPLMSGYLLHPEKIQGKGALVDVQVGGGHVVLVGFRSQWRGQPHGTFKFLFNSLYYFGAGASAAGSGGPAASTASAAASSSSGSPEAAEWRRVAGQVKADAEKLAAANKAFFSAKGAKALEESKKLEAAVTAFLRDRVSMVDGYKDQSEDRAVSRKVAEYGQAARKLANEASTKDWSDSKDVMSVYKLDSLDQEISALLNKKQ